MLDPPFPSDPAARLSANDDGAAGARFRTNALSSDDAASIRAGATAHRTLALRRDPPRGRVPARRRGIVGGNGAARRPGAGPHAAPRALSRGGGIARPAA